MISYKNIKKMDPVDPRQNDSLKVYNSLDIKSNFSRIDITNILNPFTTNILVYTLYDYIIYKTQFKNNFTTSLSELSVNLNNKNRENIKKALRELLQIKKEISAIFNKTNIEITIDKKQSEKETKYIKCNNSISKILYRLGPKHLFLYRYISANIYYNDKDMMLSYPNAFIQYKYDTTLQSIFKNHNTFEKLLRDLKDSNLIIYTSHKKSGYIIALNTYHISNNDIKKDYKVMNISSDYAEALTLKKYTLNDKKVQDNDKITLKKYTLNSENDDPQLSDENAKINSLKNYIYKNYLIEKDINNNKDIDIDIDLKNNIQSKYDINNVIGTPKKYINSFAKAKDLEKEQHIDIDKDKLESDIKKLEHEISDLHRSYNAKIDTTQYFKQPIYNTKHITHIFYDVFKETNKLTQETFKRYKVFIKYDNSFIDLDKFIAYRNTKFEKGIKGYIGSKETWKLRFIENAAKMENFIIQFMKDVDREIIEKNTRISSLEKQIKNLTLTKIYEKAEQVEQQKLKTLKPHKESPIEFDDEVEFFESEAEQEEYIINKHQGQTHPEKPKNIFRALLEKDMQDRINTFKIDHVNIYNDLVAKANENIKKLEQVAGIKFSESDIIKHLDNAIIKYINENL